MKTYEMLKRITDNQFNNLLFRCTNYNEFANDKIYVKCDRLGYVCFGRTPKSCDENLELDIIVLNDMEWEKIKYKEKL